MFENNQDLYKIISLLAPAVYVMTVYHGCVCKAIRDFARGGGSLLRHAGQLADHVVEDAAVSVVGQLRLSIKPEHCVELDP